MSLYLTALTLNPYPRVGKGLPIRPAPLLPAWEKGLGDEGALKATRRLHTKLIRSVYLW
ncbi:MAG: hypothetical protein Fur0046_20430 [Cyanobacteria bacterium J069]